MRTHALDKSTTTGSTICASVRAWQGGAFGWKAEPPAPPNPHADFVRGSWCVVANTKANRGRKSSFTFTQNRRCTHRGKTGYGRSAAGWAILPADIADIIGRGVEPFVSDPKVALTFIHST